MCSWGAGVVIGMDSECILCLVSCVLYLVRVTGWLGCFSGGCTPQNFKENLSYYMYVSMHIYYICHVVVLRVTLLNLYAVERQVSVNVIIDNKDSVFCLCAYRCYFMVKAPKSRDR